MLQGTVIWDKNMVRSLIVRLMKKGAVGADCKGRYFRYYPIASEAECVRREVEAFVERVFEGNVLSLFSVCLNSLTITQQELQLIYDQMEEQSRRQDPNSSA